jgi:hypothetical protein
MDDRRFDTLTRALGTGAGRRAVLKAAGLRASAGYWACLSAARSWQSRRRATLASGCAPARMAPAATTPGHTCAVAAPVPSQWDTRQSTSWSSAAAHAFSLRFNSRARTETSEA